MSGPLRRSLRLGTDDGADSCFDGGALGTAAVEALAVDVAAGGFGTDDTLMVIACGSLSSAGRGGGRLRGAGELLRAFDVVLSETVTDLLLVGEEEACLFWDFGSFPLRT